MTDFNDTNEILFPLEDTICKYCANRFSRQVIPIDFEEWGIDLDELDIEEEDEVIVEQHVCLILYQDIDCIVQKCNNFKPVGRHKEGFFARDPF